MADCDNLDSALFIRSRPVFGDDGVEKIRNAHVMIFGIGGVGSFAVEALARAGIGRLTLIDGDEVSESNLNRQLIATTETIGMPKAEAAKARIRTINPAAEVNALNLFYDASSADSVDFSGVTYVADAIDNVTSKVMLLKRVSDLNIPVISCMGAGNKLDPTRFRVTSIGKTSVCPLAKVMRRELKKCGADLEKIKAVWSDEEPAIPAFYEISDEHKRVPASVSFVPSAAGIVLASEIIKDIIK